MISENVFLHGLAGAKLRLSTTGDAGLLQHFQKLPPAGIAVANDLLFRFPSLLWLRRSEGKTLKFASLCKNLQVFQTPAEASGSATWTCTLHGRREDTFDRRVTRLLDDPPQHCVDPSVCAQTCKL